MYVAGNNQFLVHWNQILLAWKLNSVDVHVCSNTDIERIAMETQQCVDFKLKTLRSALLLPRSS
jgi:hypothetical protein